MLTCIWSWGCVVLSMKSGYPYSNTHLILKSFVDLIYVRVVSWTTSEPVIWMLEKFSWVHIPAEGLYTRRKLWLVVGKNNWNGTCREVPHIFPQNASFSPTVEVSDLQNEFLVSKAMNPFNLLKASISIIYRKLSVRSQWKSIYWFLVGGNVRLSRLSFREMFCTNASF